MATRDGPEQLWRTRGVLERDGTTGVAVSSFAHGIICSVLNAEENTLA
jgi:hypothetical protein